MLLHETPRANFGVRFINTDGVEAEMCGNGVRCIAKYIVDNNLVPLIPGQNPTISFCTLSGISKAQVLLDHAKNTKSKTTKYSDRDDTTYVLLDIGEPTIINSNLEVLVDGVVVPFNCTIISMGNPHCVIQLAKSQITDDLVHNIGKKIETHELFPKKTNVEFICIEPDNSVYMRVWERSVGETLSCGSGACASVVAALRHKWTSPNEHGFVNVHTLGGTLEIRWERETNHVFKTGPATNMGAKEFAVSLQDN